MCNNLFLMEERGGILSARCVTINLLIQSYSVPSLNKDTVLETLFSPFQINFKVKYL